MKHLRTDYEAIQPWPTKRRHIVKDRDGANRHEDDADLDIGDVPHPIISDDEPVFLLRAKDRFAPGLVVEWAELLDEQGTARSHRAVRPPKGLVPYVRVGLQGQGVGR